MKNIKIITLILILSPLCFALEAPASPETGPVYNFNFYNKGSIPENSASSPKTPLEKEMPSTPEPIPTQATPLKENSSGESAIVSKEKTIFDKDDEFLSFFYQYGGASFEKASGANSQGNQKLSFIGNEAGIKYTFKIGTAVALKYLFGNVQMKVFNQGNASNNKGNHETPYRGIGMDLEQRVFERRIFDLFLGASYNQFSFGFNGQMATEDFSSDPQFLKYNKTKVETIVATLRPQVYLTKFISVSAIGGYGRSRAGDADGTRFMSNSYQWGLYSSLNF